LSVGRTRFDGTPAQSTGLGKIADDPLRYKREWAQKRRADSQFRERENEGERLRKKLKRMEESSAVGMR
jgi:hypothetical protein